ncbi:hypothetical protein SDC9_212216 [bioreactor metagenome]|uniref:Uncharacterized protein n=1 Tax=bioreactor metagenome TaxID=1076179 RepID=A0A645JY23_9ZZZZ
MPGAEANEADALGLSIPLKNVGDKAWRELQIVINILKD